MKNTAASTRPVRASKWTSHSWVPPLKAKVDAIADIAKPGAKVMVGKNEKTVKQLLTLDGVKVIFEDDSWMLVRPSGTEPKVRIYTECREPDEKDPMFEAAKALFFKN